MVRCTSFVLRRPQFANGSQFRARSSPEPRGDYCTFAVRQLWQHEYVAKRRKPKPFRAVEAVKAMAREHIGAPPASRVVPDKRKQQETTPKHKPSLAKLMEDL